MFLVYCVSMFIVYLVIFLHSKYFLFGNLAKIPLVWPNQKHQLAINLIKNCDIRWRLRIAYNIGSLMSVSIIPKLVMKNTVRNTLEKSVDGLQEIIDCAKMS